MIQPRVRQRGFSFVELIVSVAILATLASVAMPLAETAVRRKKESELRIALQEIRQALDAYKLAAESGNVAVKQGESGYPPTLAHLAIGVPNARDASAPVQYFLRRIPRDPFHPDRSEAAADTWGKRSFVSPAEAPEEGDDVFDVYSLSDQMGSDGLAYKEW